MAEIDVSINTAKILKEKKARLDRAQKLLDRRVLADSNYYVPFITGDLMRSGRVAKPGLIEWVKEYAKAQYYGLPRKTKEYNPNARMKWFEAAKAARLKEWGRIVNDEYRS